jgi:hypothetical protein
MTNGPVEIDNLCVSIVTDFGRPSSTTFDGRCIVASRPDNRHLTTLVYTVSKLSGTV